MIYLHVYYMFFNFVTFLYYLILNLCDNVFIFIMCTKVLGQVPARKIPPPPSLDNCSSGNFSLDDCPPDNCPPENCP